MTVKTESRFLPELLSNHQYSGMMAILLYNWSIFAGMALFSTVTIGAGLMLPSLWGWLFLISGLVVLGMLSMILLASFVVYDWGEQHEYDRLAELGNLDEANVVVDITCGKLRGTRGFLAHFTGGHYFLIDIYDADKMPDHALERARAMEPSLITKQRIFRRAGQSDRLPLPHNWADVVYCSFSLHELHNSADRQAILSECSRMLKPKGRLLIAEHGRDWQNFIAFGPGMFSFFSPKVWKNHFEQAGLVIKHHEKWRGLVNLWVLEQKHE
jgi:ubiquinone/menaquinone biosynthesis C-methylase UbiE